MLRFTACLSFTLLSSLTVGTVVLGSAPALAASSQVAAQEMPWPARKMLPRLRIADVVVEGQRGTTAEAPVTVPVPAAPVPAEPTKREIVRTDIQSNHNYMATIAWSAVMGGVLGAAVGAAVYFLDTGERARNIVYWAAGGVLLGTAVGVTQVLVQESRTSEAVSHAPEDPVRTFRLALYHVRF